MHKKSVFSLVLAVALAGSFAGLLMGCSGADDPTIPDVPAYTPPPAGSVEQQKIPGRPGGYGASTKYQQSMESMNNPQ